MRPTDFPATLAGFVDRIPFAAEPDNWPVHVAGHPPGALGFFVALDRVGLGSGLAAGLVVTLLAAEHRRGGAAHDAHCSVPRPTPGGPRRS